MTDDDVQLYLSLKFSSIAETLLAFRKAIRHPEGFIGKEINTDRIVKGIHKWTELGCPEILDIKPEDAEFFLAVKFGSIRAAYNWWVHTPPGNDHGLSRVEELIVMDYIDVDKDAS